MLSYEARQAVARLADTILSTRPLVDALARPVRVAGADPGLVALVNRVGGRLGAAPFVPAPGADLDVFDQVVSGRLDLAGAAGVLAGLPLEALPEVDEAAGEVLAEDQLSRCERATVPAADGTLVDAYAAGDPQAPPVLLASPCGMPARLAERWIRHLAKEHLVLTWESRGLFGTARPLGGTGVADQVGDLFAVMDHFEVRSAHLAGLCGGAVLALAAAARRPDRVRSLSLWHGDFELGADAPKTGHQRNLQVLMAMAASGRVPVAQLHTVLCQSLLSSVPPDLAHLVLLPYATPVLLLRYCQLNGAIMGYDARPLLPAVTAPTLVVTSRDDETAHPDGSRYVAAALPGAGLVVTPHGDHLSLFRGEALVLDLATRFIAEPASMVLPAAGRGR